MYSNNYVNETTKLIRSCVICTHGEAVSVNLAIKESYPVVYKYDEDDISTWKHYVNMTGEFHDIDKVLYPDGIKLYVEETDSIEVLSKELLETYETLRTRLLEFGKEYDYLVSNHKTAETIIRGMLLPVDMKDIIECRDGSILKYNDNALGKNETTLMLELNIFAVSFRDRWMVVEYVLTDELYIADYLVRLYASLFMKCLNVRLSKIGTEEASSYYIDEFFKSNLDMNKHTTQLTDDVRLYLYKNLKYLINNTGKEHALRMLIDNVLSKSGIIVEEIVKKQQKVTLSEGTPSKNTESLFIVPYGRYTDSGVSISAADSYYQSLAVEGLPDLNGLPECEDTVATNKTTVERTKVLVLDYNASTRLHPHNEPLIVFENWVHAVFNKGYVRNLLYTDQANLTYTISEETAAYLVLKYLLILSNLDTIEFSKIVLSKVPTLDFSDEDLISGKDVINDIHEYLDNISIDYSDINSACGKVLEINSKLWTYMNDSYNPSLRSDASVIFNRIHVPIETALSSVIGPIDDKFVDPVTYSSNYDYRTAVVDIVTLFVGINIDKKTFIDKLLADFKYITDELTSYTTQVVPVNNYPVSYVTNDFNGKIVGPNLLQIDKAMFVHTEPALYDIALEANNVDNTISDVYLGIGNITQADRELYRTKLTVMTDDIVEVLMDTSVDITYE